MGDKATSARLLDLLSTAVARELQVSVHYMLQHGIGAGRAAAAGGKAPADRSDRFVASHSLYFMPGATLKKIAIAEMRHAEAVVERLVLLGGDAHRWPEGLTMGESATEMLQIDKGLEESAIELYGQIVAVAREEHDDGTMGLFQRILSEEHKHHQVFSGLLQDS